MAQTNGDLASIPDQATNEFLTTLSTDISYIGASDAESEGTWKWTDGTTWGYESWFGGGPNNANNQDYGTINYGGAGLWDDQHDWHAQPFFCQYQYDLGISVNKNKQNKLALLMQNLELMFYLAIKHFIYF